MSDSIVYEVIEAVAAADGVTARDVAPLHEYIDPELLVKLDDQDATGDCKIVFEYADHQVTVTQDSAVFVDGVAHSADSPTSE